MENPLLVFSFALLPILGAVIGSIVAAFRPPSPVARSYIQHTAAGVVFSVVAVELLPNITHQRALLEVAIGFTLGVAIMLGMRYLSHILEKKQDPAETVRPMGLLLGVGIDILLDGFLIGVSFAAGAKEGLLLTVALTLEMISLGLAVSTALGKTDKNRMRVILTSSLLFLTILVGTGIGIALVQYIPAAVMEVVLSFGLAALMYLVTEELLVEAHREPESPMATGMFFLGFLIFLLLGMME